MRRRLILFIILLIMAPVFGKQGLVLDVKGVIDPTVAEYVHLSLLEENYIIIIRIDTPGGLGDSMMEIVKDIESSDSPVVVYVYPSGARAASAGTFILMSSHIAAMAPGTTIGAAHPVEITGQGEVPEKITEHFASYMKALAERHHRNVTWAEYAVRKSMSATPEEALKFNVIELIADNTTVLLEKIDNRNVSVKGENITLSTKDLRLTYKEMTLRQQILHTLSNPNVAYVLFMIGIYGIILELSNPGATIPGVLGGLCIILALWSFNVLSMNKAGIALIIFALILFIAELLTPTYGALTVGGIISLILGSLLLPNVEKEPFIKVSFNLILASVIVTAGFFILVLGAVIRTFKRKPTTGREGMVGLEGITITPLKPEGEVKIHGEIWKAISLEGDIEKDTPVVVEDIKGLRLYVRRQRSLSD
ncbi:MAG: nodulation protein NfeD [Candidatus Hydrothermarchaeota archaeon]